MTETPMEAAARALKAEIARQFGATPAPGPDPRDDWTATGGTIELEPCAKAAVSVYLTAALADPATIGRIADAVSKAERHTDADKARATIKALADGN